MTTDHAEKLAEALSAAIEVLKIRGVKDVTLLKITLHDYRSPKAAAQDGCAVEPSKPGDKLTAPLLSMIRICVADNIGTLELKLDDVVLAGVNEGTWLISLRRDSPTGQKITELCC
jgi:hypothetical protein